MNRIGLYLDDVRSVIEKPSYIDEWIIVRSYEEFKQGIIDFVKEHNELPAICSFDHDVHNEHIQYYHDHVGEPIDYVELKEKTGMHCAKWFTEFCDKNNLKPNYLCVHSHNPIGASNIMNWLNFWLKNKEGKYPDKPCFQMRFKFKLKDEDKVESKT